MAKKIPTTYRLTEFAKALLEDEAERRGDSQTGVLERLIRENLKAPVSIYVLSDIEAKGLKRRIKAQAALEGLGLKQIVLLALEEFLDHRENGCCDAQNSKRGDAR